MRTIPKRRWLSLPAMLASAAALALGVAAAPGQAVAAPPPPRLAVADSHPAWASQAADAGQVPATTAITARVYLAGRDPDGLAAYAQQVSDPSSAAYGHYLTPAQYQQRFGPTTAQASAVRQWLTGAGMHVTGVTSRYVAVSGTEETAAVAFGAALHNYRVDGILQRAPQTSVTVPASVAPAVLSVVGLATGTVHTTPDIGTGPAGVIPAASGTVGPVTLPADSSAQSAPAESRACSEYWGQLPAATLPPAYGHTLDYDLCGYVPRQLRAAYGVAGSGLTGKGATIAVVDPGASPTIVQDVNTYMRRHSGQPLRPGQLTQYLPPDLAASCGTSQAPYGEEHLDFEAAHTMAPDASLVYVAMDCSDITTAVLDAEGLIVDDHLADIVSDSWHVGIESQMPPGFVPALEQIFEQGAVEGIGFYFSSGDHGDWSPFTPNGQTAVQYPGSDPWVTSVGGTSLATGPGGNYRWETGWGDDIAPLSADGTSWVGLPGQFGGGTGGGPSELFAQPFYQRGIVPDSLSRPAGSATAMRVMPDIAADADPATGMLIGFTAQLTATSAPQYVEQVVGGTSESSPLIAGIQADAEQATGAPIGFANPAIYERYGTRAYHDVTDDPLGPGELIDAADAAPPPVPPGAVPDIAVTMAHDTSLRATPGYDNVTGVGSPTPDYLRSYHRR